MQQRQLQRLLTCNTPSSKCHSWHFITYSVLTREKQKTPLKKKSAVRLFISTSSFTLLIMLLDNLPISFDEPLKCIFAHVSIKVETYCIVLNPKLKIKFCTRWNPKCFEKYMSSCILSFLFHNNNSITINKFNKWATIRLAPIPFIH